MLVTPPAPLVSNTKPGGEAKLGHQLLTAVLGGQEHLQVGGALDLDQGEEMVHLLAGLLLLGVAKQVGHDSHVVLDVGAQWDGDGPRQHQVGVLLDLLFLEHLVIEWRLAQYN